MPIISRDVRIILLNGPSESGKSVNIAPGLMYRMRTLGIPAVQDSFANPMKHFIATTLGVKYSELKKNSPMAVLQGYTPREFLIDLSEHYIKRRYGDDFYGRALLHRVLRLDPLPAVVIVDDSGFDEERDALKGHERVVRISRPGKTFAGDSRKYLEFPQFALSNDGTLEDLENKLDILSDWIVEQIPLNIRLELSLVKE